MSSPSAGASGKGHTASSSPSAASGQAPGSTGATGSGSSAASGGQELLTETSNTVTDISPANPEDAGQVIVIGGTETYSCSGNTLQENDQGQQTDTMTRVG